MGNKRHRKGKKAGPREGEWQAQAVHQAWHEGWHARRVSDNFDKQQLMKAAEAASAQAQLEVQAVQAELERERKMTATLANRVCKLQNRAKQARSHNERLVQHIKAQKQTLTSLWAASANMDRATAHLHDRNWQLVRQIKKQAEHNKRLAACLVHPLPPPHSNPSSTHCTAPPGACTLVSPSEPTSELPSFTVTRGSASPAHQQQSSCQMLLSADPLERRGRDGPRPAYR
jgi:hypothetical protein